MQHEVLTASGAILRYDSDIEAQKNTVEAAIAALGGEVLLRPYDGPRETVLSIMEQSVLDTTLTAADGTIYMLSVSGWYEISGSPLPVSPYHEDIVSATMPGGWSWSRQYETFESEKPETGESEPETWNL